MVRNGPSAATPGDAEHPLAAMLDTYPAEEVVKLLIDEEGAAFKAAKACATEIARASRLLAERLAADARLIYVGVGTAGRIAAIEAAECVPLYALPPSLVVSVLAGGPHAMARTVEISQDSRREAEQRMRKAAVGPGDVVCAVADDELSVFLIAAIEYARFRRAHVVLVTCAEPPAAEDGGSLADILIRLDPGPDVITGSSRPKAATTIKLALSAFSNAAFVQLGKTYGGLMVDVRPTTPRTWKQAIRIVTRLCGLEEAEAEKLIKKAGGRAKVALVMHHARVGAGRAKELIVQHRGSLRTIVGDLDLSG
jgi:N-acetylmuramic acid 6-phosphate etherase